MPVGSGQWIVGVDVCVVEAAAVESEAGDDPDPSPLILRGPRISQHVGRDQHHTTTSHDTRVPDERWRPPRNTLQP